MLLKKLLVVWFKHIGYGLLLLWVGGIGPLIYFDAFSPHQGLRLYHITLLEPVRVRQPLAPPPEPLESVFRRQLLKQTRGQSDFVTAGQKATAGLAHFFESSLGQGFLFNLAQIIISNESPPISRVSLLALTGRSAWLSPPEKPPSIFLT